QVQVSLGEASAKDGKYLKAVEYFIEAIDLGHDDAATYVKLGEALVNAWDEGKSEEMRPPGPGESPYGRHRGGWGVKVGEDGKFHVFTYYVGSRVSSETIAAAVFACRQAIARQPDFALAWAGLGTALDRQKKYDEAVVAFRRAVELKPTFSLAYARLGFALV